MSRAALRWALLAVLAIALVLVQFALFEGRLLDATEAFLESGSGRAAVSLWIGSALALDVFLPVPSSLLATASGMLLGIVPGMLVTWTGMQAGAFVGYWFGRSAGAAAVRRFVGGSELARAERSHRQWGGFSLIAGRAVPVLAEASVVLAGAARMPVARFATLTAASNLAIAAVYGAVGAFALEARAFLLAFGASVALPGMAMLLHRRFMGGDQTRQAKSVSEVAG